VTTVLVVAVLIGGAAAPAGHASVAERIVYVGTFREDWGGGTFVWRMGALYTVNADGSGARQITTGSPPAAVPALSPDGQTVAFVSGRQDLYTVSVSGGSPQLVFSAGSNRELNHPSWSPDGQRLVFTYTLRAGMPEYSDIYSISAAGTDLRQLIGWKGEQLTPTYSPDGQRLAFSTKTDPKGRFLGGGHAQMWITGAAGGSSGTPITTPSTEPNGAYNPAYSPTGAEIAFHRAGGTIRRIRSDGIGGSQLVSVDASGGGATWSPDGQEIAWESQRDDPINLRTSIWHTTVGTGLDEPLIGLESGAPSYRQGGRHIDFAAHEMRPVFRFDSGETYRPLHVDKFFAERNDQAQPLHDVCTSTTCVDLVSKADLTGRSWIDIAGDGNADTYHSPYNACTNGGLRDCDSGERSAIYYWGTIPSGSSAYYTDYWVFYRYNDWPFLGAPEGSDHEGDWESVTVAASPTTPNTFDFVSFSQHGGWYSYLRENLSCDGLGPGSCTPSSGRRRVDVYVSKGSHANYADQCDETIFTNCPRNDTGITDLIADGSRNGDAVWGNNSTTAALVNLPAPTDASGWGAWPGDWGAPPGFAPSGPAHGGNGDHFYAPWITTCADGNDGCPGIHASRTRTARSARLRGNDRCPTWFGANVLAAVCAPRQIRSAIANRRIGSHGGFELAVRRAARRSRIATASGAGIAQAVGKPLRPGERLMLKGRLASVGQVLVRGMTRTELATARFDDLRLERGEAAVIAMRSRAGRPAISLRVNGVRHKPSALSRTGLVLRPRPRVRAVRRSGDRLSLAYSIPGDYGFLDFSGSRRGPALVERYVPAGSERVHRRSIAVPAGASYLRLAGVRKDGARSRVATVRVPP